MMNKRHLQTPVQWPPAAPAGLWRFAWSLRLHPAGCHPLSLAGTASLSPGALRLPAPLGEPYAEANGKANTAALRLSVASPGGPAGRAFRRGRLYPVSPCTLPTNLHRPRRRYSPFGGWQWFASPDPHSVLRFAQAATSGSAIATLQKGCISDPTVKVDELGSENERRNAPDRTKPTRRIRPRTGQILVTGHESKTNGPRARKTRKS